MRSFEIYGLSKATIILFTQFNINVRLFLIWRKRCQCNITTLSKNNRDSDQKLCLRCRGHSLFDIGVNYLRFLQHDRVDPSLMSLLSLPPPPNISSFRHVFHNNSQETIYSPGWRETLCETNVPCQKAQRNDLGQVSKLNL